MHWEQSLPIVSSKKKPPLELEFVNEGQLQMF